MPHPAPHDTAPPRSPGVNIESKSQQESEDESHSLSVGLWLSPKKDRDFALRLARFLFREHASHQTEFLSQLGLDPQSITHSKIYKSTIRRWVRAQIDSALLVPRSIRSAIRFALLAFLAASLAPLAWGWNVWAYTTIGFALGIPIAAVILSCWNLSRVAGFIIVLTFAIDPPALYTCIAEGLIGNLGGFTRFAFVSSAATSSFALIFSLFVAIRLRHYALQRDKILYSGTTAQIVNDLVEALVILDGPAPLALSSERAHLIELISQSACFLRRYLPRLYRIPNNLNNSAFAVRCADAAAILDSYALWVALPKADTARQLHERLALYARALFLGTLDELPSKSENPARPTIRQRARTLGGIVRVLIAGAIPLGLIFVAHAAGIWTSGPVTDAVTAVCVAWAIITYVSEFDPVMNTRVVMLKDVAGSIKDLISK